MTAGVVGTNANDDDGQQQQQQQQVDDDASSSSSEDESHGGYSTGTGTSNSGGEEEEEEEEEENSTTIEGDDSDDDDDDDGERRSISSHASSGDSSSINSSSDPCSDPMSISSAITAGEVVRLADHSAVRGTFGGDDDDDDDDDDEAEEAVPPSQQQQQQPLQGDADPHTTTITTPPRINIVESNDCDDVKEEEKEDEHEHEIVFEEVSAAHDERLFGLATTWEEAGGSASGDDGTVDIESGQADVVVLDETPPLPSSRKGIILFGSSFLRRSSKQAKGGPDDGYANTGATKPDISNVARGAGSQGRAARHRQSQNGLFASLRRRHRPSDEEGGDRADQVPVIREYDEYHDAPDATSPAKTEPVSEDGDSSTPRHTTPKRVGFFGKTASEATPSPGGANRILNEPSTARVLFPGSSPSKKEPQFQPPSEENDDDASSLGIAVSVQTMFLVIILFTFTVILSSIGTSYYGAELALRGHAVTVETESPLPGKNETMPSAANGTVEKEPSVAAVCEDGEALLKFEIEFDSKAAEVGLALRDTTGTFGAAIWSFEALSFRSVTQLQRKNAFSICLSNVPNYELVVTDASANGLISEFGISNATLIFGQWSLTYGSRVVAQYHGDCTAAAPPIDANADALTITECGDYCICSFRLSTNATIGGCDTACTNR